MTLSNLLYFCAVCKHKNITKAADELHVTQPSITRAMKDLEAEFGVNLFLRRGKRLDLTPEGVYFLSQAQQIVDKSRVLEEQMKDFGDKKNHITICMPSMIGSLLFPDMFSKFHALHPEIYLEMHEYGSQECYEFVRQDRMDFAVAALEPRVFEQFHVIPIVTFELLFCVSPQHPLAGHETINLQMLKDQMLIIQERKHLFTEDDVQYDGYDERGSGASEMRSNGIKERFQEVGIEPQVMLYTKQIGTIKKLLTQTDAGAFLFREVVEDSPEIVGIPIDEPMTRPVGLLWKRGKYVYNDMDKFIQFTKGYTFEHQK